MMKAVLCLALVCCFVAVVQAAGCECTPLGMMECACKPANKNVIKAKVVSGPIYYGKPLANGHVYKIIQKNFYKGADMDFKRVYVSSRACVPYLKEGDVYILMGQYKGNKHEGKKIMEVHRENNLAIYFDYLDDVQIKKLRELKEGRYVC